MRKSKYEVVGWNPEGAEPGSSPMLRLTDEHGEVIYRNPENGRLAQGDWEGHRRVVGKRMQAAWGPIIEKLVAAVELP